MCCIEQPCIPNVCQVHSRAPVCVCVCVIESSCLLTCWYFNQSAQNLHTHVNSQVSFCWSRDDDELEKKKKLRITNEARARNNNNNKETNDSFVNKASSFFSSSSSSFARIHRCTVVAHVRNNHFPRFTQVIL